MKRFITKTRFLGLLVCFLPLSVSAGELDGKSLICERVNVDIVFGYRFQKGKVKVDVISDLHWMKKPGEYDFIEADYSIRRDTNALLGDLLYTNSRCDTIYGLIWQYTNFGILPNDDNGRTNGHNGQADDPEGKGL